MIALIAARSSNNVIGNGMDIPWKAKGEQRLFRDITLGNTLIMGRKTFVSIGRALPGRDTIIVTRQSEYEQPGCQTAHSLPEAIRIAETLSGTPFIAGGGEIYSQIIGEIDVMHLTTVQTRVNGDVFFPEFNPDDFEIVIDTEYESNINYRYQKLRRKTCESEA